MVDRFNVFKLTFMLEFSWGNFEVLPSAQAFRHRQFGKIFVVMCGWLIGGKKNGILCIFICLINAQVLHAIDVKHVIKNGILCVFISLLLCPSFILYFFLFPNVNIWVLGIINLDWYASSKAWRPTLKGIGLLRIINLDKFKLLKAHFKRNEVKKRPNLKW